MNHNMPRTQLKDSVASLIESKSPPRLKHAKRRGEADGQMLDKSMRMIRMDKIRVDPNQVRSGKKGPEHEGTQQLANSIRQDGQLQPIVVRYLDAEDVFEVVSGERRYHALALLGKTHAKCNVRDKVDDETKERLQLVENIQREDLPPLDIALALQKRVERGDTPIEIQAYTNKSKVWVSRYLKIGRQLTAENVEQIRRRSDAYSTHTLYDIAGLPVDQRSDVIKHLAANPLNKHEAHTFIKDRHNQSTSKSKPQRPYTKTVKLNKGVVVKVIFPKAKASSKEVDAILEQAQEKLRATTKSPTRKAA